MFNRISKIKSLLTDDFVLGCAAGVITGGVVTVVFFRYFAPGLLLAVTPDAINRMIADKRALMYVTEHGDFLLKRIPN